jgi:hypothetical protein
MGVKKQSILSAVTEENHRDMFLKFVDDGMYIILAEKGASDVEKIEQSSFVSKEMVNGIFSELLAYLASFDDELPELIRYLEDTAQDLKDGVNNEND